MPGTTVLEATGMRLTRAGLVLMLRKRLRVARVRASVGEYYCSDTDDMEKSEEKIDHRSIPGQGVVGHCRA